ncbi:winged helix-turn-helix transcriptional regulator [Psychrobacter immobilis]|uniref:winged helix-turn-helix transcriptional regulator n=1 Tax=Psychrobacter immobilis TaxID=498 RepID=UPI00191A2793|nr:helix-turn-helix domain-containing protein [Psychrobacter immobilis]
MAKVSLDKPSLANCPIARSLSIYGDTWCMLILRDAHMGLTRFDEFRSSLGISPSMLTKRLATLVDEGLFEKRRYSELPPREEYLLTQSGQDILPVLFVLATWARAHKPSEEGVQIPVFIDSETGVEIEPIVIDKNTGIEIGKRAIQRRKS